MHRRSRTDIALLEAILAANDLGETSIALRLEAILFRLRAEKTAPDSDDDAPSSPPRAPEFPYAAPI